MGSIHSSFLNSHSKNGHYNSSRVHPPRPPPPLVPTDKGPVEGKQHKLKDGRMVNVFLSIPFAKPPVGPLRFRKPEDPDPWGPIPLPATRYKARAIQCDFIWDTLELRRVPKSEDCLYLNVVSPGWDSPDGGPWPVMVYIHGGGYIMDSAVKYHYAKLAQNLVRHGVIVVTIQYRLGLLGFLSTGDAECPGNFGLWDQLFALRWVHKNIAAFGGDPTRITLFGHSAGAASADLLALSPLSRDLFQQVILMGGSAETIWAVGQRDVLAQYCRKKAKELGFRPLNEGQLERREESAQMMDYLRTLPAGKFELTLLGDRTLIDEIRLAVSPVIDGELLPKSPKELRAEAPTKRVICGQCQHEGLLFLALGMRRANGKLLGYCERRMEELLEEARRRMPADSSLLVPEAKEVRQLYGIDNEKALLANKPELQRTCVAIMSDLINNVAMYNFCRSTVTKPGARVWRFMFEHFNPDSSWALNAMLPFKASTHGNELHYVFDINFFVVPWRRTAADKAVLEMMIRWWTNFAKWGDPNGLGDDAKIASGDGAKNAMASIEWRPSTVENVERHLNIAAMPKMKEGTAESQRVARLGPAYRALVQ